MPNATPVNPPMTQTMDSATAATSTLFLGHSGEWWDFLLIVSAIFVALSATMAGVASIGSIVSHKRETAAAERALDKYKIETGKQISEANDRAAQADRKASEADLARLKIEEKLLIPRWLNPDQQSLLERLTKPFPGTVAHIWIYPAGTPDSFPLAFLLDVILTSSSWKVASWTAQTGATVPGGVVVTWRDGNPTVASAARALIEGLAAANIGVLDPGPFDADDMTVGPQFPSVRSTDNSGSPTTAPDIRIWIGSKTNEMR